MLTCAFVGDFQDGGKHERRCFGMENCRTNELLSEQIAIIQEFAPQLDTMNLQNLEANLAEIEMALNNLKELMKYLPK